MIVSGAALFTMFPGHWLWNIPPVHMVTPIQTQPMSIDLDANTNIEQIPTDWFVEIPGVSGDPAFEGDTPTRQLVHQPTIIAHDLYLLGLIAVLAGLAVRGTFRRRATWAGAALVTTGVVAQLLVSPL